MKLIQLILVLITIFCNEIVVELVVTDEHKISILDNSAEENTESEKTELEVESDFINENGSTSFYADELSESNLDRDISNITNPFLEIHSPPPDHL